MEYKIPISADFSEYINLFLEENARLNLISKNDEKLIFEKHIYDSLSIKLFFEKYGNNFKTILDIGCGGGFPSVPIAIEYPNIEITGVDSIRKKIESVNNIKSKLSINNLHLICNRIENLENLKFDIVVCRAVSDLAKISKYALPFLNRGGYFIAYKSKKADEEIAAAYETLNSTDAEIVDTIEYTLPTEAHHQRKLICIKKL